jgi:hypothetical protein
MPPNPDSATSVFEAETPVFDSETKPPEDWQLFPEQLI